MAQIHLGFTSRVFEPYSPLVLHFYTPPSFKSSQLISRLKPILVEAKTQLGFRYASISTKFCFLFLSTSITQGV
jgi:hypothetical protein